MYNGAYPRPETWTVQAARGGRLDKPNTLLIFTDQHRLSALGCHGQTPCRTPNIDQLAAGRVRFETAHNKYGWNCSNRDELHDLARDPHEMTNLIDDPGYADVVRGLRPLIDEWMADTKYPGRHMCQRSRLGAYAPSG